jgi:hypothetical protein
MFHCVLPLLFIALALRIANPLSISATKVVPKARSIPQSGTATQTAAGGIDEVIGWQPAFYNTFLSKYFQKRPLVVRKAVHGLPSVLDIQLSDYKELAGDDDVETRIFQTEKAKIKKYYGPFKPKEIEKHMSQPGWSLLVQEMDRHVPQVADLWSCCFPFLPNWRRDDIMFSLSAPGGSIGAHVDNYDVFLLQGRLESTA